MNKLSLLLVVVLLANQTFSQNALRTSKFPNEVSIEFPTKPQYVETFDSKVYQAATKDSSHTFLAVCIDQSAMYDSLALSIQASRDGFWQRVISDLMKTAKNAENVQVNQLSDTVINGQRKLEFERIFPNGQIDRIWIVLFVRNIYLFQFICVNKNYKKEEKPKIDFFKSLAN